VLLLLLDRVSVDAGFRRLETRARAFSTSVTATTKSLIEKIAIGPRQGEVVAPRRPLVSWRQTFLLTSFLTETLLFVDQLITERRGRMTGLIRAFQAAYSECKDQFDAPPPLSFMLASRHAETILTIAVCSCEVAWGWVWDCEGERRFVSVEPC